MDSSEMTLDPRAHVWKMFNQISSTYDKVNRIVSLGQDVRWRKKVAKELPLKLHLEVLDIASGTGDQIGAFFAAGLSIQKAVGVDLANEMLAIARKKFASIKEVEFLHGDAQKLPFKEASFDAASFSFGIRNVEDPLKALQEMRRVLKPKGKAFILEFSMPNRWVRPLFLFYLRSILPRLGGLFSKQKSAYQYLNRTVESFPSGAAFCAWMEKAGFKAVKRQTMNFGSVTLYSGEK
ncbi:MAG TPA: bifunctional demethylmenaquinone methyltransferase/2-methoxy-6-polyprenyl-1,4-benzoquinol methylase UbiE [Chlamydiales bacterium]|jgi:demethylmenaquinone methyltransferase/2-methoxy-6-polyprenyl-1,4-benzoquinol methylase